MSLRDYVDDGIAVISLSGRILGGDLTMQFHQKIHSYLDQKVSRFIIDLEKVDWSNSLGIGMLIAGLASVERAEGHLVLANITNIKTLLAMTRLLRVFDCYDSVEEAKKAFA